MKIETGTESVYVETRGKGLHLFGANSGWEKNFSTISAAQKWASKNIELTGGDEVDEYILTLINISSAAALGSISTPKKAASSRENGGK